MTINDARIALAGPLIFGDKKQCEAMRFLADVQECASHEQDSRKWKKYPADVQLEALAVRAALAEKICDCGGDD